MSYRLQAGLITVFLCLLAVVTVADAWARRSEAKSACTQPIN